MTDHLLEEMATFIMNRHPMAFNACHQLPDPLRLRAVSSDDPRISIPHTVSDLRRLSMPNKLDVLHVLSCGWLKVALNKKFDCILAMADEHHLVSFKNATESTARVMDELRVPTNAASKHYDRVDLMSRYTAAYTLLQELASTAWGSHAPVKLPLDTLPESVARDIRILHAVSPLHATLQVALRIESMLLYPHELLITRLMQPLRSLDDSSLERQRRLITSFLIPN